MPRPKRLDIQAQQDGWLTLLRGGMKLREIAAEFKTSIYRVHAGITEARFREARNAPKPPIRPPGVVLMFGSSCKPVKTLRCDDVHRGPLPEGTRQCCGVCHRTGIEDHPGLRRDPERDPKPEPKPKSPLAWMSRSQRRALKRALKSA